MALNLSPRKVVPLASGDDYSRPRKDSMGSGMTKRVFFCGVVVEGSEHGKRLPEDIQDLVLSLGSPLPSDILPPDMLPNPHDYAESDTVSGLLTSLTNTSLQHHGTQRKRALTDSSALLSVINELVTSERSYVKRLQILKHDYADPLRSFARSKDTAIIPAYEAKILFGNLDNLLPVNEAFLTDLEKMLAPNGRDTVGGVGDVALKHFKDLRGFEQYKQYYVKREDAQLIFEREVSKRSSRFASFIDHIKYQSADPKNRVGLRELLMEPVQRIPRYTLLFRTMLKHMTPGDPQRAKITEADEIASKIAQAEADEQTKRAAIFYCLTATIDGFPPDLFSNSRRFIDCIDVEDIQADSTAFAPSSSGGTASLHCTLFLFDDKLVFVKRPGSGEKSGRVLSGLDELEKVTKAGGIPAGKKKSGMTCKGVVDITEIVATDVGGADFHFYLECPPQDPSDRWSGRSFRAFSVVHPPHPPNMNPAQTSADKQRFLENLWHVQATYRCRAGQSVVLRANEQEVESKGSRVTTARTYYNVYQRTAFLQEPKKTKIVVHIDPSGSSDPIPLGMGVAPFASVRIQPLAGQLSRYTVRSNVDDEVEEDIVQTERVPSRIVDTIHQFGFFEFRTGLNSRPSTPTARSRVAIFGLDALSRNLFNSRPGSAMGEFFGGSINGHKRTKSTASRTSTYTQTTTTGDGSLTKFSRRSNSTAATSVMDDESFSGSGSRKMKKGKYPGGSTSDSEKSPGRRRPYSLSRSRSPSRERDANDTDSSVFVGDRYMDDSERELALQLELARRNSKNQHGNGIPSLPIGEPVEATIYEEPPQPARPLSRASHISSHRSTTPRPDSLTPTKALESPTRRSRSPSQHSQERRPLGPRSPSPLPSTMPLLHPPLSLFSADDDNNENSFEVAKPSRTNRSYNVPTGIPRSKRQPFFPTGNTDSTPKPAVAAASPAPTTIEPLSIKKKTSVRGNGYAVASPTPVRKVYSRNSPLTRNPSRVASPRRVSPQVGKRKLNAISDSFRPSAEVLDKALELTQTTLQEIETSRSTIKRIRIQADDLRTDGNQNRENDYSRPSSPIKEPWTPQRRPPPLTKDAQERMEEMRQVIGRRFDDTPRRLGSIVDTPTRTATPVRNTCSATAHTNLHVIDSLASEADTDLAKATSCQEMLQENLKTVSNYFKEKAHEVEKARIEIQNAKRQTEVVKSLLADATAEKDIMYEAFNEELDGMFNDINLPDDEAWAAMSKDLKQTKEARNTLAQENSRLKLKLAESEMQRDEWEALLRAHGLIS